MSQLELNGKLQFTEKQVKKIHDKIDNEGLHGVLDAIINKRKIWGRDLELQYLTVEQLCRFLYVANSYEIVHNINTGDFVAVSGGVLLVESLSEIGMKGTLINLVTHEVKRDIYHSFSHVKGIADYGTRTCAKKILFWDKIGRDVDTYFKDDMVKITTEDWTSVGFVVFGSSQESPFIHVYDYGQDKVSKLGANQLQLIVKAEDRRLDNHLSDLGGTKDDIRGHRDAEE